MFYIYFQRESHGLCVHLLSVQMYNNDKNICFMMYVRQTDRFVMQKQPILRLQQCQQVHIPVALQDMFLCVCVCV